MLYSEYINRAHRLRLELFKNPDYDKLLSIIQQASSILQDATYDPDIKTYDTIIGLVDSISFIIEVLVEDIRKYEPIPGHCKDCQHLEITGPYAECRHSISVLSPDDYCSWFEAKGEGTK